MNTHDLAKEGGKLEGSYQSLILKVYSPENHLLSDANDLTALDECQCGKVEAVVLVLVLFAEFFDLGPDIIEVV